MASLNFRAPQFSGDVAWLPAWLQANQSTKASQDDEDGLVGTTVLISNRESNAWHLYLSGEECSQATLSPPSSSQKEEEKDKALHFNLHLSTDGSRGNSPVVSDSLLHVSQGNARNSSLGIAGTGVTSPCRRGHQSPKLDIVPSPSIIKFSGCSANQTLLCNDASPNTFISQHAQFDDASDAVELSVAASEALVIHKVVKSGSLSEALSASAILEVTLQVKQARLDGLKDCSRFSEDFDTAADILSCLGDSDMEDAYIDVGLSLSSLDNFRRKDSSISRVKETPVSEIPGEDKQVRFEWQGEPQTLEPQEKYQDTNFGKTLPVESFDNEISEKVCRNPPHTLSSENQSQNGVLDKLQTSQDKINNVAYEDALSCQLKENSSPPSPQPRKETLDSIPAIRHSHHVDMNEVRDRSSCRFQSRWLGGWTGTGGEACLTKLAGRKTIPNFFVGETSFLSESVDVFADQNSVAHNHHVSSNASESEKPSNDSFKTACEGPFVSQEVVKDSMSYIDPLCSMVPCSISEEIGHSILPIIDNDSHQALDGFKSLQIGAKIPMDIAQTYSSHNDENIDRERNNELNINGVGPYPLIRRQLTSLRTYSTGLTGYSALTSKRNLNCGVVSLGENDKRVLSELINSPNDKNTWQLPIKSMSNCAIAKSNQEDKDMKLLLVEQDTHTDTSEKIVSMKQPPIKSIFSATNATNDKERHVENASGRLIQDHFRRKIKGVEPHVHLEDIPASPLVLGHRKRRFKAPELLVSDASIVNQLEDQAPAPDKICHDSRIPQSQIRNFPKSGILARKRVRFLDIDYKLHVPQGQSEKNIKRIPACENLSSSRLQNRPDNCDQQVATSQEVKECLTKCRITGRKRAIFHDLDFLLTGFSKKNEKEIEGLLRKHGGTVLSDIPAPLLRPRRKTLRFNAEGLPVVLCTKKLQTTRFLYGCAVHAFLLKVGWVYDSIRVGSVLPPDKYLILSSQFNRMLNQIGKSISQNDNDFIFHKVGIMLHGTHSFCAKISKVIKHGRGHVYKSLQWLVQNLEQKKISRAAIVVENENRATRHLKKCASEQKIALVPERWLISSLLEGKLLPLEEKNRLFNPRAMTLPEVTVLQEWSQEI